MAKEKVETQEEEVSARDVASVVLSRRNREVKRLKELPQDEDFATLDDLEDILEPVLLEVPIISNSGKEYKWVLRSLTAGEKSAVNRTMFPKSALNSVAQKAVDGKVVAGDIISQLDSEDMLDNRFKAQCLAIQKATVRPEGVTLEQIEKLNTENFDALSDAVDSFDEANDEVSRFPETDAGSENGEEPEIQE